MALEPWVNRFRFERKDAECAFVNTVQWRAGDEALDPLDSKRELTDRQAPFSVQAARPQRFEVPRKSVLGSVNNAESGCPHYGLSHIGMRFRSRITSYGCNRSKNEQNHGRKIRPNVV